MKYATLNAGTSDLLIFAHVPGRTDRKVARIRFKLHTRRAAAHLYPLLHSPAWIFDCELLLLASLAGIPAAEVGIKWQEVGGSKVDLIKDSIAMAIDLLVIRGNYWFGRWESPERID